MRRGVAVVAYRGGKLELLRDCRIDGSYGFLGMTTKEQVLRMEDADEIRANLPTTATALVGKIGASVEQGTTLDVALVMVGVKSTTWHQATARDLRGDCARASHFVRAATVGAFAMQTGSRGRAAAVAEIFGIGGGASGASTKHVRSQDGALDACRQARPDSDTAPAQCGALLKLRLTPIGYKAKLVEKANASAQVLADNPCPAPLVHIDGKCASPTRAKGPACKFGDGAACESACRVGDAHACGQLGVMFALGRGVPRDARRARTVLEIACRGGSAAACTQLGLLIAVGGPRMLGESAKAFAAGCDGGNGEGCGRLGNLFLTGDGVAHDPHKAAILLDRGCRGGFRDACSDLGVLYLGGSALRPNQGLSARLFKLACDGKNPSGCGNLGTMLEFGYGVRPDKRRAVSYYALACKLDRSECMSLGILGIATARDASQLKKSSALIATACKSGFILACAWTKLRADPRARLDLNEVKRYVRVWKPTCAAGIARDCTGLGVLSLALGEKMAAAGWFARGCKANDPWGCAELRVLAKQAGQGGANPGGVGSGSTTGPPRTRQPGRAPGQGASSNASGFEMR